MDLDGSKESEMKAEFVSNVFNKKILSYHLKLTLLHHAESLYASLTGKDKRVGDTR